jgi:hypothetical protein
MAYDAATQTVVLFKGSYPHSQTWTWNGSTWTRRHPATSPSIRTNAAMAYDSATKTVVLFGGRSNNCGHTCPFLNDTWTWNGSTWTRQHPATSPPARWEASMRYDAATRTVVLFGGGMAGNRPLNDTWTWNGTGWTQRHPATSPPAQELPTTAYDYATRTVVLLDVLDDTWTWNGTNWTQQHPATSPPAREAAAMAYDAATSSAVLFGGCGNMPPTCLLNDTWTWNGTDWTQQHPATSPPARDQALMAYDGATRTMVLFGGRDAGPTLLNDTWTWNGSTWTQQSTAR